MKGISHAKLVQVGKYNKDSNLRSVKCTILLVKGD
jgi:hypothetical protein